MKQIHKAKHALEAHFVKGFLESNGIEAEVRGDLLTSGWGELPVDLCSVWITDDEQFDQADELLIAFLKGIIANNSGAAWACPGCEEILERQFTACWKCGARRPQQALST